jgi:two-component system LytT family response regulator
MLKAESNYTIFYLQNGQCVTTSKTLKSWIDIIQYDCTYFQRVHRSYYIHTHHVQMYQPTEKYVLLTGEHKIQVARRQKFKFSL